MDDAQSIAQRALHLRQVEKLSQRQIAQMLHLSRKRITRILRGDEPAAPPPKAGVIYEYAQLIAQWYTDYPRLKATQIYERLKSYEYAGSYVSVVRYPLW